jgi:hypothetical protein
MHPCDVCCNFERSAEASHWVRVLFFFRVDQPFAGQCVGYGVRYRAGWVYVVHSTICGGGGVAMSACRTSCRAIVTRFLRFPRLSCFSLDCDIYMSFP